MENNNCCDVLMQVLKENMNYHDTHQRKFNNKVVFFAVTVFAFAAAVTIRLKEQNDQIEKLKYELEDMKNKEE